MGLVASAVLRCDDCVAYHLETCYKEGVSKEEIMETLSIATLIGGTIVIPHLRKAYEFWKFWKKQLINNQIMILLRAKKYLMITFTKIYT